MWWLIPAAVTVGALIWAVAGRQSPSSFGSLWGLGLMAGVARLGLAALAPTIAWAVYLALQWALS